MVRQHVELDERRPLTRGERLGMLVLGACAYTIAAVGTTSALPQHILTALLFCLAPVCAFLLYELLLRHLPTVIRVHTLRRAAYSEAEYQKRGEQGVGPSREILTGFMADVDRARFDVIVQAFDLD